VSNVPHVGSATDIVKLFALYGTIEEYVSFICSYLKLLFDVCFRTTQMEVSGQRSRLYGVH